MERRDGGRALLARIAQGCAALVAVAGCSGGVSAGAAGSDAGRPGSASAGDDDAMAAPDACGPGETLCTDCSGAQTCSPGVCSPVFCPAMTNPVTAACPAGAPLSCYVDTQCPNGSATTITGTVYDPAGRNPVPNAVVFVPNYVSLLPVITQGSPACNPCSNAIGDYVTVAQSNAGGSFTLQGVPTGDNVPLVIQIGKWRRVISVPRIPSCQVTTLDPGTARLPRSRQEGDLPQIALLTGGCDNLGCMLLDVGIDPVELSAPHAGGRVDVYQGVGGAGLANGAMAGDCTTDACPLWSSTQSLEAYDTVLLGCECTPHDETKPAASRLAMHDWLGEGGAVLATHSQTTWFQNGPADFQAVASWTSGPSSGAAGPFIADNTFARGVQFGSWLVSVGAAGGNGVVSLDPANVSTSVTTVAPSTSAWIRDSSTVADGGGLSSANVKLLSFRTPIPQADADASPTEGGPTYCGQVTITDIHAGGGQATQSADADGASSPTPLPAACSRGPMTPEEKALEYFLFQQPACFMEPMAIYSPPPPIPGP